MKFFIKIAFCSLFVTINIINAQELKSPNGLLSMQFTLEENGVPIYKLSYKDMAVVKSSSLGLELKNETKSL